MKTLFKDIKNLIKVDKTRNTPPTASYVGGGCGGVKYRFSILADGGVLRYEWAPDGKFEDRPSFFATRGQPIYEDFTVKDSPDTLEIITYHFRLKYNKQIFTAEGLQVQVLGLEDTIWRFGESYETLGGTCRTLDGRNGRCSVGGGVASRTGYAHIDDSHTLLFTSDGFISPREPGPDRIDGYLFCYGHNFREAVKALYLVSGPQPLLPKWALGNWWSRFYEYSEESYLELLELFKEHDLPLSVAVLDMDWHLVDDKRVAAAGSSGWTGYTWNRRLFPNPRTFIQNLHSRNLKVTLNEHPAGGIYSHEDSYYKMAKALGRRHNTSQQQKPIAFDCTDKSFMKAYFNILLKPLEADGVDFWWIDWQSGTQSRIPGIDPLQVLNHFHYRHNAAAAAATLKPASRSLAMASSTRTHHPLILSRYAGAGSHRYPLGFSGDTVASWKSLAFQPEFTATASNIGFGWWSHDIGGFVSQQRDDELIARWIQLGVFSPILRLHSNKKHGSSKEPWKLAGGSDQSPQTVAGSFLRLRHRLIPYIHTMNARAALNGEPLIQPMYWNYPELERAYTVPNQYFFGTDMMVIPITSPMNEEIMAGKVHAWLPEGKWVDFFTGVIYAGDRDIWLHRPLDKYPVLLKQGSIIPLDICTKPNNGVDNQQGFEVIVVVGENGSFEILEEQTASSTVINEPFKEVNWRRTTVTLNQSEGIVTIGPTRGGDGDAAIVQTWSVLLLGLNSANDTHVVSRIYATVDGMPIRPQVSQEANGISVQLGSFGADSVAQIHLDAALAIKPCCPCDVYGATIHLNDIKPSIKKEIESILAHEDTTCEHRISRILTCGADPSLQLLLVECMLSSFQFSVGEDGQIA